MDLSAKKAKKMKKFKEEFRGWGFNTVGDDLFKFRDIKIQIIENLPDPESPSIEAVKEYINEHQYFTVAEIMAGTGKSADNIYKLFQRLKRQKKIRAIKKLNSGNQKIFENLKFGKKMQDDD